MIECTNVEAKVTAVHDRSDKAALDLPADCYYNVFGENRVVCRRSDQLPQIAEHVARHPDAHVVIEDRELCDMAQLAALPETLTGLILPVTAKSKKNLPALKRFTALNRLLVCAKVANTDVIAQLPSLRHLRFYKTPLKSLSSLAAPHQLETLVVDQCRINQLGDLSNLSTLKQLVLYADVTDAQSLQELAKLTALERLSLCSDTPITLPPLHVFKHLRYLSLTAPVITTSLHEVWQAPALQALSMNVSDRASEQPYQNWLRSLLLSATGTRFAPHPTLRRVWLGSMTAVQRQVLANWLMVPVIEEAGHLELAKPRMSRPNSNAPAHLTQLAQLPPVETSTDSDDADDAAIQARVNAAITGRRRVVYAAYSCDADDRPIDNLDDIAWRGACRFVAAANEASGLGLAYRSADCNNPTWLQVATLANDMLEITDAGDHVFLEGLQLLGHDGDLAIVQFLMGS